MTREALVWQLDGLLPEALTELARPGRRRGHPVATPDAESVTIETCRR